MEFLILVVLIVVTLYFSNRFSQIQETLERIERKSSHISDTSSIVQAVKADNNEIKKQNKDDWYEEQQENQIDKYKDVVPYIQQGISSGLTVNDIVDTLGKTGWSEADISIALSKAGISRENMDDNASTSYKIPQTNESAQSSHESSVGAFFTWLSHDWLMKIGAFFIILAFGWFVSYSFAEGWIGPGGRITMGIIIGICILLVGEWRIKKYVNQGAVLMVLGSAGILITIFSARLFYSYMFSSTAAAIFMLLVVAYLGLSSVRHKSKALAILALVTGYIVPLLTNASTPDVMELFIYLLVVSAGVIWVAGVTGWRALVPSSLVAMFLYSFSVFDIRYGIPDDMNMLYFIVLVIAVMYFLASMAAMVRSRIANRSDLFTAAGIGAFVLMWSMVHLDQVLWSFSAIILALVFSIGAFGVYRTTSMREPFYVYGTLALVCIGIATALELDGPVLALVAIFEVTMVIALIKGMLHDTPLAQHTSLLMIIPGLLSLESFTSTAWANGIIHGDFVVLVSMAVSLAALGFYFDTKRSVGDIVSETGIEIMYSIAGLYTLALIWLVPYGLFADNIAIVVVLVIHTIIGLYFYLTGHAQEKRSYKILGIIFIAFVILRILPLAWELSLLGRFSVFTIIGILLMSTAFIGRSKK